MTKKSLGKVVGEDATINGKNAIEISQGSNVTITEVANGIELSIDSMPYNDIVRPTNEDMEIEIMAWQHTAFTFEKTDNHNCSFTIPNGIVGGFETAFFTPDIVTVTFEVASANHNVNGTLFVEFTETTGNVGTAIVKTQSTAGVVNQVIDFSSFALIDMTKQAQIAYVYQNNSGVDFTAEISNFSVYGNKYQQYPEIKDNLGDTLIALAQTKESKEPDLKVALLGASITAALGETAWHTFFQENLGCQIVANVAMGGAALADWEGTTYPYNGNPQWDDWQNNVLGNQIAKLQKGTYEVPDLIIIDIGSNGGISAPTDEQLRETYYNTTTYVQVPLENVDRKTSWGAFRYAHETLHEMYPNAQIFWLAPINATIGTTEPFQMRKPEEIEAWGNTLEKLTRFASQGFIDTKRCGINWLNEIPTGEGEYLYDGLHPNRKGAQVLGGYITSEIRNKLDFIKILK